MRQQVFGIINVLFSFSSGSIQEGDDVRSLTLWHGEASPVTVADFQDQWLVLYFYPKANTPGCTREAISYNELLPQFHEANAEVMGISTDSEAKHQRFQEKQNLKLRFVSDPDGGLAQAFGIKIILGACARDTVVINPSGQVDAVFRSVNPKANAQDVLAHVQHQQQAGG